MVIYGAGGHARVIISCILANNQPVKTVFDDNLSQISPLEGAVICTYDPLILPNEPLIIAVGDNQLRKIIAGSISHSAGNIIHPSSEIESDVKLGQGTVVLHGSIIQSSAKIGCHVIVNTRVTIDHHCVIGSFVHLAPGVILCGNVNIGDNTLIGAGAIVVPNISIGSDCHIAAGSVITKNIPDGCTVRGNPGRIIKTVY